MARNNLLAVEVSVSQETIDTLLSRKTLETLLPRALRDDVLVALWRSMQEPQFDPVRSPSKSRARGFAADWVRAIARNAGLTPAKTEYCFWELLEESRWLVRGEVAYRVADGAAEAYSKTDQAAFVRWLRILRKGGD